MAPEAYTLKAALDGWIAGEDDEAIRQRAAQAYDKYQKCGSRAALRLFATGW
jgi:phage-related baseplate assembly protein